MEFFSFLKRSGGGGVGALCADAPCRPENTILVKQNILSHRLL